ncbi:glycosyltransferase family 2 protein [Sinorhizobium fredii]
MRYPFDRHFYFPKRNIIDRLQTFYDSWRVNARERRNIEPVIITPAKNVLPLDAEDLPLVFVTHNEMALTPAFLHHYRRLGVTRFICLDDVSSDGTREYLMDQPDVDVWTSPIRFAAARRGRRWREALFERYGYNRWYVNVDSDEFLVYDQCLSEPLKALVEVLENNDIKRLPAPMLDFYPVGTSGNGSMPWHAVDHVDCSGYRVDFLKRGISVKGGPRKRLFKEENELIKYPLIFWDKSCYFGSSIHRPLPYSRNFAPIWGVLLHFKFFTNYREKIGEAASNRQHYNGSEHYQALKR